MRDNERPEVAQGHTKISDGPAMVKGNVIDLQDFRKQELNIPAIIGAIVLIGAGIFVFRRIV